jgi:hypothetical chaperone protein
MDPTMRAPTIGFDFGTTNSTVALAHSDGTVESATFPLFGRERPTARSILFFDPEDQEFAGHRPKAHTGNPAIERYEYADGGGRLILSPKSWLACRSFGGTAVFGHRFAIEHLVGAVVQHMRDRTREQFGIDPVRVVAGRPVHFARGEGDEDDDFAEERLRRAFRIAGITDVTFEYEPIGAAYAYEQRLDDDELILIGDFGGGTSDFCLLAVGPSYRGTSRKERRESILGTDGVGRAGDAGDARIMRKVVAPLLGEGSSRRGVFGDEFPIPGWIYRHLERWHRLSMLRAPDSLRQLKRIQRAALEPVRARRPHDLRAPLRARPTGRRRRAHLRRPRPRAAGSGDVLRGREPRVVSVDVARRPPCTRCRTAPPVEPSICGARSVRRKTGSRRTPRPRWPPTPARSDPAGA